MKAKPFPSLDMGTGAHLGGHLCLRACAYVCAPAVTQVLPATGRILGSVCRVNTGIHVRAPMNGRGE